MSKKGDAVAVLQMTIGIILAVLFLLLLLKSSFVRQLLGIVAGESKEATFRNFDALVERLNTPVSHELPHTPSPSPFPSVETLSLDIPGKNFFYVQSHPFYIDKDYILVGFNRDTEN